MGLNLGSCPLDDDDGYSMLDVRTCHVWVSELAADSALPWDDQHYERVRLLAVHFGVTKAVAWLVGTALVGKELDRRPRRADLRSLEFTRDQFMRHFAAYTAEQVIQVAIDDMNPHFPETFESILRRRTFHEMKSLARESTSYIVEIEKLTSTREGSPHRVRAVFERLPDLERIVLLTKLVKEDRWRPVEEQPEHLKLNANELASIAGLKVKTVRNAHTRALKKLGKVRN